MSTTSKEYYKRQLDLAADLISRRLVLWMSLYESGKCIMYRVSAKQLVREIDRGSAPVVYSAALGLDLKDMDEGEFNNRLDHGIVWLGDTSSEGYVLGGALLISIVQSVRQKVKNEKD